MALNDQTELVLKGFVNNPDAMIEYLTYAFEVLLIHESSSFRPH